MSCDCTNRLLAICRSGVLKKAGEETVPEPYIPFVPDNLNGGLVLAEAQNHGAKSREYLEWLRGLSSRDRMLRFYMRGEQLGCQPWDDGSPIRSKTSFPDHDYLREGHFFGTVTNHLLDEYDEMRNVS